MPAFERESLDDEDDDALGQGVFGARGKRLETDAQLNFARRIRWPANKYTYSTCHDTTGVVNFICLLRVRNSYFAGGCSGG